MHIVLFFVYLLNKQTNMLLQKWNVALSYSCLVCSSKITLKWLGFYFARSHFPTEVSQLLRLTSSIQLLNFQPTSEKLCPIVFPINCRKFELVIRSIFFFFFFLLLVSFHLYKSCNCKMSNWNLLLNGDLPSTSVSLVPWPYNFCGKQPTFFLFLSFLKEEIK